MQSKDVQAQRDEEQSDTQRKGHKGLWGVELKVTCQLADDFHSNGGHCFEWIGGQIGRDTGGHHHNHGFTNRPRGG